MEDTAYNAQNNSRNNDEAALIKDFFRWCREACRYLMKRWKTILVVGLLGGLTGLIIAVCDKPKYTARMSFSLNEGGASSTLKYVSSILGASFSDQSNIFAGDNLLEIMKTRHAIEHALLKKVDFYGTEKTLAEAYIDVNHLRKKWEKSKDPLMHSLSFPAGQKRETFSRLQDSVLCSVYKSIVKSDNLLIDRVNTKVALAHLSFSSKDELFSKLFVENLMQETYDFYKQTKIAKSQMNIDIMTQKADSLKQIYEEALYKSAELSQVHINPALKRASVPYIRQQTDIQIYASVYSDILSNIEALKLDLARETPIVQIIDVPRLPLEKKDVGIIKGVCLGGFIAGVLVIVFFLLQRYFKNLFSK